MRKKLLVLFTLVLCGAMFTLNAQDMRRTAKISTAPNTQIVKSSSTATILFEDSFETGDLTVWHEFIQGDGTPGDEGNIPYFRVVNQEDVPEFAVEGEYLLQADWGYDIDTWIISPEIAIEESSKLSFFYNSSYYWHVTQEGGSLFVKVSEDGGENWDIIWDWQQIGEWTSWTWYGVTLDLANYAGKNVHVAFNLVANDNSAVSLDYIQVFNGEALSHDGLITDFSFVEDPDAVIEFDGYDIIATVSYGTDITALTPSITVSAGATIVDFSPTSTIDFTNPVDFVVVSESGAAYTYTVWVEEEEMFEVTFNVDMTYADFDPASDVVYITGDLLDWAEPGSEPENQTMTRVDDSMIWTKTFMLSPGEYQYKYFVNAGWTGTGEWEGGENRMLTVAADMEVNDIFGWKTSVDEPAVISNLNVYPNPFNNEIRIANAENVARITITNLIGQVVMDMPYRGETTINTSDLNNGLYLVVFQSANGQRVVRKMIKQ